MNREQFVKFIKNLTGINDIGDFSDGYHTFNGLYHQRAVLFAALVNAYKDKSWKSWKHENGELCFGGGWFIVGIDTPLGSYTYHYEEKYWNMFNCAELEVAKHWDGHTEDDAETRLLSLKPEYGCWLEASEDGEFVKCSACGEIFEEQEMGDFCPNCGVKLGYRTFRHRDGTWKDKDFDDFKIYSCSECGYFSDKKYNYCTNCGAKMK